MLLNPPDRIESVDHLDNVLSQPTHALVEFVKTLKGPLVVLGAAGKMGPTLCLLARRAIDLAELDTEVIGVSRFSSGEKETWLNEHGIKTIRADLLRPESYSGLPDSENVIFLVGQKFGTADNPELTWAINTIVPTQVAERYRTARIVALSTGNVYPLVEAPSSGCVETDPVGPIGEYANACLARERLFEYAGQAYNTRSVLIRLNYAVELRYGVLVDIAQKIKANTPIDVTTGYLNYIWQRDANERVIRSLDLASNPPSYLNLTGARTASVRKLAETLGRLMDRPVTVTGKEARTAFLSNAERSIDLFGDAETADSHVLAWTADWINSGGALLGKATHFQQREGKF